MLTHPRSIFLSPGSRGPRRRAPLRHAAAAGRALRPGPMYRPSAACRILSPDRSAWPAIWSRQSPGPVDDVLRLHDFGPRFCLPPRLTTFGALEKRLPRRRPRRCALKWSFFQCRWTRSAIRPKTAWRKYCTYFDPEFIRPHRADQTVSRPGPAPSFGVSVRHHARRAPTAPNTRVRSNGRDLLWP